MLIEKDYLNYTHLWDNNFISKDNLNDLLETVRNIMSYDVKIGSFEINHTYNGAKEIKELAGFVVSDFDNLPGCVVYKMADDLLKIVVKNKNKLKVELLKNYSGWGTYDSWINFLTEIKNACKENQFATVMIG